jgi:hypothetical protein
MDELQARKIAKMIADGVDIKTVVRVRGVTEDDV